MSAFSAAAAGVRFVDISAEGFADRAYRLHYNDAQHRNDTFAAWGTALGFAAAALLLPRGAPAYPWAVAGGAAAGSAAGVAAHMLTRPAEMRYPNKALHELLRTD
ncbi:hypothetical protein HYH03_000888 [Edaphochlamys debaryana]|uniref:Uncharacterized protein n=1 Tax=Edaphochlamys debaryana TaxID=47281 RepID=A0A836C6M0_9CHLO|nr:hypothetical protein HYH03_000888 [Edaphochlamys debaryana]|eukprot:KAG2501069.1 hypothetical protein HYH03_000888 [Edaphochlamys debaryana]